MKNFLSATKDDCYMVSAHAGFAKFSENRDDDTEVETPSRGSTGTTSIDPKIQA